MTDGLAGQLIYGIKLQAIAFADSIPLIYLFILSYVVVSTPLGIFSKEVESGLANEKN